MTEESIPGVHAYNAPAGGWGALRAVGDVLLDQEIVARGAQTLLKSNQPEGFDCPGCAWPEPKHTSTFEFCENGAKAVAWEATSKRATPELFATHTITELLTWTDHALEDAGRLTAPMVYDPATDRYLPIAWETAFARIADSLRTLTSPDQAEFYASGRASNEAAFLFQLLGRRFGTNNFPDCSNMCHEPTSVGLADQLGLGKGTVSLEDFDHADLIMCFGHNPGTNHPRMMATLREASRRGAKILVFNPLRELALEKFASPQDPVEMATLSSTPIATLYFQPRLGGDAALVQGMMKYLLQRPDCLDWDFIEAHTSGLLEFLASLEALTWDGIERDSGLSRAAIEQAASVYAASKNAILCYGMGLTQHRGSSSAVQQLVNLLLLRGQIGREGAGICPLRGHSNVQGDRTVGIAEKPSKELLDSMARVFHFEPPRHHGHTVVEALAAIEAGASKAFIGLGGNFAVAAPDPQRSFCAMAKLDLAVHVATKLNRTHLLTRQISFLLPCLGRTEIDVQAAGRQSVTVEDSMSMVHASRGVNQPASPHLKSEVAIVAGIGAALWGDSEINWTEFAGDYDLIRDKIEAVFPVAFRDYNARIRVPGGFRLPVGPAERTFATSTGRAKLMPWKQVTPTDRGDGSVMLLTTVRSHDQYNTTIYGQNDRYRGVFGRRDVVFISPQDLARLAIEPGDLVDIEAAFDDTGTRALRGVTVVSHDLPLGCIATYYPEANGLVMLDDHDEKSGTPAYKSAPVRILKV